MWDGMSVGGGQGVRIQQCNVGRDEGVGGRGRGEDTTV